jgi:hypothetical protein
VGKRYSAALVKVVLARRPEPRLHVHQRAAVKVQLYGAADDRRGIGEIARAYTILGIEHILSGSITCCSWPGCCSWWALAAA